MFRKYKDDENGRLLPNHVQANVTLSSSDDRLKANTDYALVGATSDLMFTTCAIVARSRARTCPAA